MPPVIPNRHAQLGQMLASGPNGVRALASQQDIAICDTNGLVTYRQGQLQQWPPASDSPSNFAAGYGWEILSNGLGSLPVQRGGMLTWTRNSLTADQVVQVFGTVYMDASGLIRKIEGLVTSAGTELYRGSPVFDTSGNLVGYLSVFNTSGSFVELFDF